MQETVDKLTEQYQADVAAITQAKIQLSDAQADRPAEAELAETIGHASTDIRAYIFYLAQNARAQNWRDKKPAMERVIPIFRALIKRSPEEYDRNYGQLAYALKDKRNPDWNEAEKNFGIAIELRGPADQSGREAYEANRAICRINTDENFKQQKEADVQVKAAILHDLYVATTEYWTREWLEKEKLVNDWLALNNVKWKDVFSLDA